MGVPSFYRWLVDKYPMIVADVVESDSSPYEPNPNGKEYDCLYLDMNGLVHPCCHPESGPQPQNEDEMISAVFKYVERIFAMVRPRTLVYMALDGVAPRAKMNQQRARRFKTAKEAEENAIIESKLLKEWKGATPPPKKASWDSNVITPGTRFMDKLAKALQWFVHDRISNDPAWNGLDVILSDSSVPGEGEHKVIQFIRRQRTQPGYNPNMRHAMYGMDADLIMLGLATHEANFSIIREVVTFGKGKSCNNCGETGHFVADCTAPPPEKPSIESTPFQFLHLNVLREYLHHELEIRDLPFDSDPERAIDDFVMLCFFVGNDFLPHLPSLDIREGAIDDLIIIYKEKLPTLGGYICDKGHINLARANVLLKEIGYLEAQIFRKRREDARRRAQREERDNTNKSAAKLKKQKRESREIQVVGGLYTTKGQGVSSDDLNQQAANELKRKFSGNPTDEKVSKFPRLDPTSIVTVEVNTDVGLFKDHLKSELKKMQVLEVSDNIRLGDGNQWKERYYKNKFEFDITEVEGHKSRFMELMQSYVEGLCWVMLYYYDGCPSWGWYYKFHYAPLASDLYDVDQLQINFELGEPFSPLSQLMAVLPALSGHCLPDAYSALMTDPKSPIIDIYPESFECDLNGKRFAWQAVVLLPFLDETKLLDTLAIHKPNIDDAAKQRDETRDPLLLSNKSQFDGAQISALSSNSREMLSGNSGVFGWVFNPLVVATIPSPLEKFQDILNTECMCSDYDDPDYSVHICALLRGVEPYSNVLSAANLERMESMNRFGGRSILKTSRRSGYNQRHGSTQQQRGYVPRNQRPRLMQDHRSRSYEDRPPRIRNDTRHMPHDTRRPQFDSRVSRSRQYTAQGREYQQDRLQQHPFMSSPEDYYAQFEAPRRYDSQQQHPPRRYADRRHSDRDGQRSSSNHHSRSRNGGR